MALHEKRILVADTSEPCRLLTKIQLTSIGVPEENIVFTNDGRQAVEQAKQELFDVIIMNTNLLNLSGYHAAELIKEHYQGAGPTIIAYTAKELPQEHVFDDYFRKGPNADKFADKLLDILTK